MGWTSRDIPDQRGRTFVVTGANGGLGEVITRALVAHGATVVMACRNTAKAEQVAARITGEAGGASGASKVGEVGEVTVAPLDLGDLASVRDFAARQTAFDVLVNNAGIMNVPFSRTPDGFESQFGVNHLGHFALTGLLLADDKITDRVVTLSSIAHKQTPKLWIDDLNYEHRFYQRNLAYAQSKLANLMFARELQRRLAAAGSARRSYAVHPGVSRTALFDNDHTVTGWVARNSIALTGHSPQHAARAPLFAATVPDADPDVYWGPTGFAQMRGPVGPCPSSGLSKRQDLWRRLWAESERMTGVSYPV